MKQYIQMVSVLTVIAAVCGFLLSAVRQFTAPRIEEQFMIHVNGPAVQQVLAGSSGDPLAGRRQVVVDGQSITVFSGQKDGQLWAIAFNGKAAGFGGDVGVMVGFNLDSDTLTGIGILEQQETPGLGARITEPMFTASFKDLPVTTQCKVKKDGGTIDGVSGATVSSRAVCAAVRQCIARYPEVKKLLLQMRLDKPAEAEAGNKE